MRGRERGFTMIEMMIVVAVIAILAAVVVPTFFRESNKTKSISEVTPMFAEFSNKLEQFKSDNAKYTNTTSLMNSAPSICPSTTSRAGVLASTCDSNTAWQTLRIMPTQTRLRCKYEVQVGDPGDAWNASGALTGDITFTPPATTGWWTLLATCDSDGQAAKNGQFFMTSVDPTIKKVNEGF